MSDADTDNIREVVEALVEGITVSRAFEATFMRDEFMQGARLKFEIYISDNDLLKRIYEGLLRIRGTRQ